MERDILIFLLLALIALARWLAGEPYLLPLTWFCAFSAAVWLRERRTRERIDFVNQLKSCRRELRHGGSVVVDNLVLRYNSVLTTFHLSVGGIFVSVDIKSRYQPASAENHPDAFIYSVCSLISGWWSFPHGPLHTVQALLFNLGGGEKMTVAQLIDGVLVERRAQIRQHTVEMHHAAKRWKEQGAHPTNQEQIPDTGPGSRSQRALTRRTATPDGQSLEQRLQDFYSPRPVGTRAVEQLKERAARVTAEAKERVKNAVKKSKPS